MVSAKILSRYTDNFPAKSDDRKIPCGPLYPAVEIFLLLKTGKVIPWTQKCAADIQKMAGDADDLLALIRSAVGTGRYVGSEWCQQNPNGPWAACDAYQLTRQEWFPAAAKNLPMEYYLKFAIGKTGAVLLLVSCHPST